ncbi:MAG: geranylgeranylglycerol-phosphate geranylgeranyltransferase [Candidatus Poseidoniales archaeon]|tara:strand:+ start:392 stop:1222 length:831 start_codon:yes stop_codon:yes gene_type:complete
MKHYFDLTRPGNAVLTAIAVIAGGFIAIGPDIIDFQKEMIICCISAMMLVGGGNALNDYNDRESDKQNHPERPIPSGKISADTALTFAQTLLGLGLVILLITLDNKMPFVIAFIGMVTLVAYEGRLKATGISGNIAVGFMSGAVFLYAGMAVANPGPTLWLFGLAFLATISREIIKDIQDLEGDKDRFTLPARIGIDASLNIAIGILIIAILLSYTAINLFENMALNVYIAGISLANGVMAFGLYNAKQEDYFMGQKNIKQGMGIAMLAFIVTAAL